MILQQVWNRFTGDWKSFAVLGIGPALGSMALSALLAILALFTIGPGIFTMVRGASRMDGSGAGVYAMLAGAIILVPMAAVVLVIATTLIHGGLMGSVVAYRRGEPPSLPAFWAYAKRYFGRLLGLMIPTWVTVVAVFVVTSPLVAIPMIWLVLVVGIQSIVVVNLGVYPGYLMVAEELSVVDAIGIGFRIVTQNFREACLSGLVMVAFSAAFGASMLINGIPVLGNIAFLGVSMLYGPIMAYYFAERFEMLVRPSLGGSAQGPA